MLSDVILVANLESKSYCPKLTDEECEHRDVKGIVSGKNKEEIERRLKFHSDVVPSPHLVHSIML